MRIFALIFALILSVTLIFTLSPMGTPPTSRAEVTPPISVKQGWARPTIKNRPAVTYISLTNHARPDRLIAAYSPRAEKIEIHTHLMQNGVMKMRRVQAINIPAHETVALKPHGDHLMLFGLAQPLKEGEDFKVTLVFENADKVVTNINVRRTNRLNPKMKK